MAYTAGLSSRWVTSHRFVRSQWSHPGSPQFVQFGYKTHSFALQESPSSQITQGTPTPREKHEAHRPPFAACHIHRKVIRSLQRPEQCGTTRIKGTAVSLLAWMPPSFQQTTHEQHWVEELRTKQPPFASWRPRTSLLPRNRKGQGFSSVHPSQAPHPEHPLIQAFKGMTNVTLPKTGGADPPGNH